MVIVLGLDEGGFYITLNSDTFHYAFGDDERESAQNLLARAGAYTGQVIASSSLKHPEDFGLPSDFDLIFWLATGRGLPGIPGAVKTSAEIISLDKYRRT